MILSLLALALKLVLGLLGLVVVLVVAAVVVRAKTTKQHWRVALLDGLSRLANRLCHVGIPVTRFNRARFEALCNIGISHRHVPAASETRCKVEDVSISEHASVRIFSALSPTAPAAGSPAPSVLLYIHGGGHVLFHSSSFDYHNLGVKLHQETGFVVVSVEYRLAPEHPYPAGLSDAYAALSWVANTDHPSLDVCGGPGKRRLVVAGDSAGGNVSAVLALLARDGLDALLRPAPVIPLAHVVLIYPSMADPTTPSRRANTNATFILQPRTMSFFSTAYYGTIALPSSDFRISPLSAASHTGLPPHTIIAADRDPLVDEGVMYATRLKENRVPVDYKLFSNSVHGFYTWYFLPEARAAFDATVAAVTAQ